MMLRSLILLGTVMCLTCPALAQPLPAAPPASDFSLTIYSTADPATFDPQAIAQQAAANPGAEVHLPGYGVVRETRKIELNPGLNTVKFSDVAAGIDPTTVSFKSLTAPDSTSVLEQSYEYDLVNPDKLLSKYLGKAIIINRREAPSGQQKAASIETLQGTLLSYDANAYVLQTSNKQLPVQIVPRSSDITEIKLFDLQTGLITKPTLVWQVQAERAGEHDAQVTYQTQDLTWRADYSVVVNRDDTAADVSAWVTIVNQSGAVYPNAKLKLVAGDVQRVVSLPQSQALGLQAAVAKAARDEGFVEKSFFEYHLYTFGRPTSVANNATKQIQLFPPHANVSLSKTYVYYGLPIDVRYSYVPNPATDRDLGTQSNKKVDIYLLLQNSEKNGLGIPLPAGRIRAYKKDEADQAVEFIGEDVLQHTPKDEQIMIRLGSAFDVVGERKQTDFTIDEGKRVMSESFEVMLRNHKKQPVTVIVKENLFRWVNWEIQAASDKWIKQDARTIHIPVDVPADGEKKITYTVKYTW